MVWPLAPRSLRLTAFLCCALAGEAVAQHPDEEYEDTDPWVGFESLGPTADSALLSTFLSALGGTSSSVCQLAVRSVGNNWGPWAKDDRLGMLSDEAADAGISQALSRRISDPAALALLSSSLGHQHPCVRRAAARLLGESRTADSRRLLTAALRHNSSRVREAAALGLAHAEDPATMRELTGVLRDRDQAVVRMGAYALGELEDARAVKPLGDLLGSRDPGTRATAAWALG
jgi:HEAT repeat protein